MSAILTDDDNVNDDDEDSSDDDDDDDKILTMRSNDMLQQYLYGEAVEKAGKYNELVDISWAADKEVTKIKQFMVTLEVLLNSYDLNDDPTEFQEQQKYLQMWNEYEEDLKVANTFFAKM